MNTAFSGSGETLVAGTLRGYRSWNVSVVSADGQESRTACPCGCGMEFDYDTGQATAIDYGRDYYQEWQRKLYDGSSYLLKAVSANVTWETRDITASCATHTCGGPVPSAWYGSSPMMFVIGAVGGGLRATGCACSGRHPAPDTGCTCGIYGWYTPDFATREHTGTVFGVVEISGRVLLGTTGFRAERAKIIALTQHPKAQTNPFNVPSFGRGTGRPDKTTRLLETAGDQYPGVKVMGSYYDLIKEYPPDIGTLSNLGIYSGWVEDWDHTPVPGPGTGIGHGQRYNVGGVVGRGLKAVAASWMRAYDGEPVPPTTDEEKETE